MWVPPLPDGFIISFIMCWETSSFADSLCRGLTERAMSSLGLVLHDSGLPPWCPQISTIYKPFLSAWVPWILSSCCGPGFRNFPSFLTRGEVEGSAPSPRRGQSRRGEGSTGEAAPPYAALGLAVHGPQGCPVSPPRAWPF